MIISFCSTYVKVCYTLGSGTNLTKNCSATLGAKTRGNKWKETPRFEYGNGVNCQAT